MMTRMRRRVLPTMSRERSAPRRRLTSARSVLFVVVLPLAVQHWPVVGHAAPAAPAALTTRPASTQPAPSALSAFVQVDGRNFTLGGKPFYFVGANLNVMHEPAARSKAAETIAAAARDGHRVGRIWALGEGTTQASAWEKQHVLFRAGPQGWQEAAFRQLDRVLVLAAQHGLKLVITLSNHWKDYGGIPMYLRWVGDRERQAYGYKDRFFTNPRVRALFVAHLRRVVGRINSLTGKPYRDDPTIFAWELQNELAGTPEAAAARRAWVVQMAREIRRLDKNHLIVPGDVGYFLQRERQDWIRMCRLKEVAYCDQHVYPEEHALSRGLRNLRAFIDDRVQLAHHVVGKPIVFGEFGFADRGSPGRRAVWHRRFLQRVFFDGGNGAMVWIYQPTLPWKRRYGVLIDRARYRPVRRALGFHARRLRRHLPRARNRRLGAAQGTKPLAPTHVLVVNERRAHRRWRLAKTLGSSPPAGVPRPAPRPRDPKLAGCRVLRIPVDRFASAYFEEAGSWAGGVLVHAYGRRTGRIDYRFIGPPRRPGRLLVRLRLSSEYPGTVAPLHGSSQVQVRLDDRPIAQLVVPPDDGRGRPFELVVRDPALLRRMHGGLHRLSVRVPAGPQGNGVAIYGREAPDNREPVRAAGPLELWACPALAGADAGPSKRPAGKLVGKLVGKRRDRGGKVPRRRQ